MSGAIFSLAERERITARLDYLLEVAREEQPEQALPTEGSLDGFLAFLVENQGLGYPSIVLTGDGNLRAEWTSGPAGRLAIEFCEDEKVRFVIFANDKSAGVAGTATVGSVMGLAKAHNFFPSGGEAWHIEMGLRYECLPCTIQRTIGGGGHER